MSTSGYIKIAMLMGVVCAFVVFLLVYRLLTLPNQRQTAVALQSLQAGTTAATAPAAATETATPPTGILAVANAYPNVHATAGLTSPKVGVLSAGDRAQVIGRSADSAWLEIQYPAAPNGVGWVSTSLMTLSTPNAAVPVVQSP